MYEVPRRRKCPYCGAEIYDDVTGSYHVFSCSQRKFRK